jgi:SAM-dependent methyltransferase
MIERFGDDLKGNTYVYLINDIPKTPKFAYFVIKTIEVQSLGQHKLTPENCVVAVSTPGVIEMYEEMGFQILPLELENRYPPTYKTKRTWELIEAIAKSQDQNLDWRKIPEFTEETAKASQDLFLKYNYGDLVIELFNDPFLGDDGDITDTRDYTAYIEAFDEGASRKYKLIKGYLKNGKIVDIGCATGSIIKEMSNDRNLSESDLYGVEASRQLYAICEQRKENGEFGNENVFFYHRNIINKNIFPKNSVDTFTAFSLTHELESYSGRDTLIKFLKNIYDQLIPRGKLIIYDVIGPENKDSKVLVQLSTDDGENDNWDKQFDDKKGEEFKQFIKGLSTMARFFRFAQDFRSEEGYKLEYEVVNMGASEYIRLKYSDIAEFLSKKDYTDNWYSEMHETFCFWNFEDWVRELEQIGYTINDGSKTFTNEWIIKNRYENCSKIFDEKLEISPYPPTNIILIAEKI